MAIRDILIWPHPKLKEKSGEVSLATTGFGTDALQNLFQDLKDTVFMAGGLGLSAIQIGVPLRVMVEHFEGKHPTIWVNPRWTAIGTEKVTDEEGCLSLPDIYEEVTRFKSVRVEGLNENGGTMANVFHDYHARVFQHEIDHFNGIVYPDRMDPGARDRIRRKLMKRKAA
jgi:peptide deformylase